MAECYYIRADKIRGGEPKYTARWKKKKGHKFIFELSNYWKRLKIF